MFQPVKKVRHTGMDDGMTGNLCKEQKE